MKYLFLIIPIYVYINILQISQIKSKTTQNNVEIVYTNNFSPTPTPGTYRALASWYDRSACQNRIYGVNCKTANGEVFDETKNTIACSDLFRLGSRIKLCSMDTCIITVCNDRGNFKRLGRDFDLTPSAFDSLGNLDSGIMEVRYEVLDK